MPNFLNSLWQLNQGQQPSVVLMPNFLSSTVISRHDARLSSTTHCALRASRIIYNLTNLSRCYSFLIFNMDLCSTLPSSPLSFQLFPMLSSDSPGTLSLTLAKITKLLSFLVTLQALSLSCQSHKTSYTTKSQITHTTQLQPTLTCSSGVVTYFPRLPLLTGTLSPDIGKIYHTAMSHRYFNLAMTSDICLRYAHAAEESAFASRSPIPRDDRGTLS